MGAAQEALRRTRAALQQRGQVSQPTTAASPESPLKQRVRATFDNIAREVESSEAAAAQKIMFAGGAQQAYKWLASTTDEVIAHYLQMARTFLDSIEHGSEHPTTLPQIKHKHSSVPSTGDADGMHWDNWLREIISGGADVVALASAIDRLNRPEGAIQMEGGQTLQDAG